MTTPRDELKKRLEESLAIGARATEGPWLEVDHDDYKHTESCGGIFVELPDYHEIVTTDSGCCGPSRADAKFICAARTRWPADAQAALELLAENETLAKQLGECHKLLKEAYRRQVAWDRERTAGT